MTNANSYLSIHYLQRYLKAEEPSSERRAQTLEVLLDTEIPLHKLDWRIDEEGIEKMDEMLFSINDSRSNKNNADET